VLLPAAEQAAEGSLEGLFGPHLRETTETNGGESLTADGTTGVALPS
jgi:hypothetical protein